MRTVLEIFRELSAVPRATFHERNAADYLEAYGKRIGCTVYRDTKNNVILEKTPEHADPADCLILQAHMDMVCVGDPGYAYRPGEDPIRPVEEKGWLRAEHTTLGADDGIGVAVILKLMEESSVGYPLRAIFTTEEEQGMGGAKALSAKYLQGKYFVGLDWVSSKSTCVSCAGSVILTAKRRPERICLQENAGIELSVSGFSGGHSGTEIQYGGNAIRACAELLTEMSRRGIAFHVVSMQGGGALNSIPSFCTCVVAVPEETYEVFCREWENPILCTCLRIPEREAAVLTCRRVSVPEQVLCREETDTLLRFLCAVPNDSLCSDAAAVQQSSNIGRITWDDTWEIGIMARANSEELLDEVYTDILCVGQSCGVTMSLLSRDPCFQAGEKSSLLSRVCDIYQRQNGVPLQQETIHAGMECGYFQQKNSGLEIVILGAELRDLHTTKERMELGSEETLHRLLWELLAEIDVCARSQNGQTDF